MAAVQDASYDQKVAMNRCGIGEPEWIIRLQGQTESRGQKFPMLFGWALFPSLHGRCLVSRTLFLVLLCHVPDRLVNMSPILYDLTWRSLS